MKLLDFPTFRQTKNYDCGAIATQMVLAYFEIDVQGNKIIKETQCNKSGTEIKNIIKTLSKYGLKCKSEKMNIGILKKHIKDNQPIIIPLQAWTNKKNIDWKNNWSDGHYVVAIGYDKNKIYFADPSSIYKTYLKYEELEKRWHDQDVNEKKYINYGIAISGKSDYSYSKIIQMK
jgi:ABC-type bacteriocin/lantibiotic exporter with double-glycine peptidase domain